MATTAEKMLAMMDAVGANAEPVFLSDANGFSVNGVVYDWSDAALIFKGGWLMMQTVYGHRNAAKGAGGTAMQSGIDQLRADGHAVLADSAQTGLDDLMDEIFEYRND